MRYLVSRVLVCSNDAHVPISFAVEDDEDTAKSTANSDLQKVRMLMGRRVTLADSRLVPMADVLANLGILGVDYNIQGFEDDKLVQLASPGQLPQVDPRGKIRH